jgi:hypothetical protein
MHRPVIAILFDSCEPVWLENWLAAGGLPVLASLRDESARFELQGVRPRAASVPAWWNW